jgi:hypothetical protein
MAGGSPRSHTREILASLADPRDAEKFLASIHVLRPHLMHTREVPNGRDFLFSGPAEELRGALRALTEIETRGGCHIHLNYVQLEGYFLLRVVGSEECQDLILSYFETAPPLGESTES